MVKKWSNDLEIVLLSFFSPGETSGIEDRTNDASTHCLKAGPRRAAHAYKPGTAAAAHRPTTSSRPTWGMDKEAEGTSQVNIYSPNDTQAKYTQNRAPLMCLSGQPALKVRKNNGRDGREQLRSNSRKQQLLWHMAIDGRQQEWRQRQRKKRWEQWKRQQDSNGAACSMEHGARSSSSSSSYGTQ